MFQEELKIPKERVAVLIGKEGTIRRKIERATKTKIIIIADEGDITVRGEDYVMISFTIDIVKAIGRGFNPEIAMNLLKEGYGYELVDITEFSGKSKNKLYRLRSRVIGENGKARKHIEKLCSVKISVYGKTVMIIGLVKDIEIAKDAVECLLRGAKHGNAYQRADRMKKRKRFFEMKDSS